MLLSDAPYTYMDNAATLADWLRQARLEAERKGQVCRLAVDLETTGLDPRQDRVLLACLSVDGERAVLAPLAALTQENLGEALASPRFHKIFFNAKFDISFLNSLGFNTHHFDDAMIMFGLANAGRFKKFNMAAACAAVLGAEMSKAERLSFINHSGEFTNAQLSYAALDAVVTWRLYQPLHAELEAAELLPLYENIERPLISVLVDMYQVGCPVNQELRAELEERLTAETERLQMEADYLASAFGVMPTKPKKLTIVEKQMLGMSKEEAKITEIVANNQLANLNMNSPAQVKAALEGVGFMLRSTDAEALEGATLNDAICARALKAYQQQQNSTAPSMLAEEQIKRIARDARTSAALEAGLLQPLTPPVTPAEAGALALRFLEAIREYKAINKQLSAFVRPLGIERHLVKRTEKGDEFEGFINPVTGRVHCEFKQLGTDTGRFSASNPNIQQMPGEKKDWIFGGKSFRQVFVPPPGYKALQADYNACEIRILAEMSGDKALQEACESDDPHTGNAAAMYQVEKTEVTKAMRSNTKIAFFATMYGAGARKVSGSLGVSLGDAQEIIARMFAAFPGIKRYINGQHKMAETRGYVCSLSGRRRYFPLPVKPDYRSMDGDTYRAAVREYEMALGAIQRQAQNAPIQMTNADITKYAMVLVQPRLKAMGGSLVFTVHDELVAFVPKERAEEGRQCLEETMLEAEREFLQITKSICSAQIGDWWVK